METNAGSPEPHSGPSSSSLLPPPRARPSTRSQTAAVTALSSSRAHLLQFGSKSNPTRGLLIVLFPKFELYACSQHTHLWYDCFL